VPRFPLPRFTIGLDIFAISVSATVVQKETPQKVQKQQQMKEIIRIIVVAKKADRTAYNVRYSCGTEPPKMPCLE